MTTLSIDQILSIRSIATTEEIHWSINGQEIGFVANLTGAPEIWCVNVASGLLSRLTTGLGGIGHLAAFMPKRSPISDQIAYVSDKSGSDEIWLWQGNGLPDLQLTRFGARIEALNWSPDGQSLAVASSASGTFDIYHVNVLTGAALKLTDHDNYEVYPAFAADGARILYVRLNTAWTEHTVISMDLDGSDKQIIEVDMDFFDYHYGREFGYPTVAPDGRTFLFRSHRNGWENTWAKPIDGSAEAWPICAAIADQYDAVWSPDGTKIAYIENHNGTLGLRIAASDGSGEIDGFRPSTGVYMRPAWSPAGNRIAYYSGSPTSPTEICILDLETGERSALTCSTPTGAQQYLVKPDKIGYKSWDGREIKAYLYRPANHSTDVNAPVIMWIHGGPTSQFTDMFDPMVQYFAQQGYAVMLPNIRGSSGYGKEFEDLNNADWGHGDLRDVIAGVEYLKSQPGIDPDLIGITGTSYGGIMSMAATAWAAPGVFQAAAPISGYCDFVYMVGEEEMRHNKMMDYEFGTLPEAEDVYRRCSPIYWTQQAATPCFIIHGEGKYPGSTSSKDFALALEAAYKPFWYKAYHDETYYVSSPRNVRQMLLDLKVFFDFYLKGIPHGPLDHLGIQTRLSGTLPYRSWLSTTPFQPEKNGPRYGEVETVNR